MKQQGSLEPITQEEVDARDSTINPWTGVTTRSLPVTPTSMCTTPEELLGVVEKNLVYGTLIAGGRTMMANALFIRPNLILMPHHYFIDDVIDCTFKKVNPDTCGGKFAARLSRAACYHIPGTDLCFCYSSTGGSFKDLSRWFPISNLPTHQFTLTWRSGQGVITRAQGLATPSITTNTVCDFEGGTYANLSMNTFKGLCGAVLVSHGKGACISGMHLGGLENTKKGCYGVITQAQITEAMRVIRGKEATILSGSGENFEVQVLGVHVLSNQPLKPQSPLNFMPDNSQIEYFGSCPGASSNHSDVKVTLMSEAITDVTGVPNIYCGPKFNPSWYGWQSNLANMAVPALPFEHGLLARCCVDYKSSLLPIFRSKLWNQARPLTYDENVHGVAGKKFMDGIKMNTAIGFPLVGPKRNYVDLNRLFSPEIMAEIQRCIECYKRGERAYTVSKGCLKDEILAKIKCRLFFVNPVSLTFLVRKYFLPVLRVLQMNPLESECAVGINSHGPEWQEFHDHVFTFGTDRLIGGDYGKYDQKLTSQIIFAALRILIDLARECDYTEEDLSFMEAMTGDIVFAVIAFNGDLIGLTEGTHISGNSLTVIINGICGSLNLRADFFTKNPKFMGRFRDVVKLMTYGDDNSGSVHESITNFTIKGISTFLGEYGMIYTMPDKESELTDFLPEEDFEFLKRKSVYCEERGVHLGALVEKSIFKMLHMYMRPKKPVNTKELACALNIDTALREWGNHGRIVYEARRTDMREVARRVGIEHLCTQLDVTYDDVVRNWREQYDENYVSYQTVQDEFLTLD
jgi:hypothetical protein